MAPKSYLAAFLILTVTLLQPTAQAAPTITEPEARPCNVEVLPMPPPSTTARTPRTTLTTLLRQTCNCGDTGTFTSRFLRAYQVLQVKVVRQYVSCRLCRVPSDRRLAIRLYNVRTQRVLKGPFMGPIFNMQAFEKPAVCGVKLVNGNSYMINFDHPNLISSASHWSPGIPVINSCQGHWNWASLSASQKAFLTSRS